MRIGVFGGAFDPIHHGHLLLIEACVEHCELDEVRVVPTGVPSHRAPSRTSCEHRARMVELALEGHPCARLWDVELRRAAPSFTIETLETLKREVSGVEQYLLLASDWLTSFDTWKRYEEVAELACLVTVPRAGHEHVSAREAEARLGPIIAGRIIEVSMPAISVSSSGIRARVRYGRSIRYLTPRSVAEHIRQHGLYREA